MPAFQSLKSTAVADPAMVIPDIPAMTLVRTITMATVAIASVIVAAHVVPVEPLVAIAMIVARYRLIPTHIGICLLVWIVLGKSWAYKAGRTDRQGSGEDDPHETHYLSPPMVETLDRTIVG